MTRWPLQQAPFWQTAPFIRILLLFVAGIVLYHYSWQEQYKLLYSIVAIAAVLLYAVSVWFRSSSVLRITGVCAMHIALITAGWWLSYANDVQHQPNRMAQHSTADAFIARITAPPAEKPRTYKLQVQVLSAMYGDSSQPATGDALVYLYKNTDSLAFRQGDTILLPNTWQRISNSGNPHEFDYAAYCARNNLYYRQFLSPGEVQLIVASAPGDLSFTQRTHNWCIAQLRRYVQDPATLGLLQAMLIGDEANLDADLRQAYADTGIIHIIAISGSHITFFFALLTFLLAWIKPKKYHWLKYAFALPLLWFYVFMAGASPSAVRAVVMFTILAIGWIAQRQHNTLNQLFCTAFVLLCAQPMWLYAVGFQLSFVAVLSLVLFFKPIYRLWQPSNIILRAIWATIVASLAAELLVAPLVIYYFHLFPWSFIVANVVAYLFMGIVLVMGMLIIGCSWWPAVATLIATLTTWLAQVFHHIIYFFQSLNPPALQRLHLDVLQMLLLYAIIGGVMLWLLRRKKPAVFIGLGAACLLFVSFIYRHTQTLQQERLVVYSLNHCTHIEHIKGDQYTILATDTSSALNISKRYAILPAHIAWHCHDEVIDTTASYFTINGQHFLILRNAPADSTIFPQPIDYLLLDYTPKDLAALQAQFHPQLIVTGGALGRSKAIQLKEMAAQAGIRLHTTALDGAFIFPAP